MSLGVHLEQRLIAAEEEFEGRHFVGAVTGVYFVAGEAEVAHDEILVGIGLMNQRLEVAVVLLTVSEAAADDGDVIAFL